MEQETLIAERVTALAQDLERRVSSAQAYLASGAALFETGMDIDQQTFNRFAARLKADNDFNGIMFLGWSMRVPSSQVAAFEQSMQRSGASRFRVWPKTSESGSSYVDAIEFVAPITASSRFAVGFNLRSEPTRRAALDRAAQSRRPTISGRIRTIQGGDAPTVLMVAPVYQPDPAGSGTSPLRGFITGALRTDSFVFTSIVGQADSKLNLKIYDQTTDPEHLIYSQGNPIDESTAILRYAHVSDRVWIIKSSIAARGALSQTGTLILLAGLIIASLLSFIVRLAIQQALYDRRRLEERQSQDAIRANLTRELNHRVKNTLANVLSILSLSRRNAENLDMFVADFDGRVRALSATYNLLMQASWGPTGVISVVQTEMAPYFQNDPPRIALAGSDALIAPNDALSLGLLIHELVTNAAKFGALSNATGRISLSWAPSDKDHLVFNWQETGGPPPPEKRERGFGSDLIEKVISRDFHSDIRLDFAPSGLRVRFVVPIRQLSVFSLTQQGSAPA